MKAYSFEELKSLMRVTEKESVTCPGLESGLPKGAITEISGVGKTEFVSQFLAQHKDLKVAWIEESFSVFPVGFLQRGLNLENVLFIEAGESLVWSTLQVLKAQIFPVVVIYAEEMNLKNLRRVQVMSERAGSVVIWLTTKVQGHWPIHLRLQTERTPEGIEAHILKQRF